MIITIGLTDITVKHISIVERFPDNQTGCIHFTNGKALSLDPNETAFFEEKWKLYKENLGWTK